MAVFTPRRQWRPKRRDRDVRRRMKRKLWWRRNHNKIRVDRARRYRQLRNNSLFKQWRKKRYRERDKRRQRFAAEGFPASPCPGNGIPEIWFVFRDDALADRPIDVDMGYVCDYDPDTEEVLIYDLDDEDFKTAQIDDFLRYSEFLEDADWDNFALLMDQYYGEERDDLDIVPESEEAPEMGGLETLRAIKAIAKEALQSEPWYGGIGIAPSPDGAGLTISVRVRPGHKRAAEEALADLGIDAEIVEAESLSPRTGREADGKANPGVVLWSRPDRTFAIKMVNPRRGEYLWTGDGWKHSMDLIRHDAPETFSSEASARTEIVKKVLPYIVRWQPGWDDFVRGWELPSRRASAEIVATRYIEKIGLNKRQEKP